MSFFDKVFKQKKSELSEVPRLEPSSLEANIPSFRPHMENLPESEPPKPEEFGIKKEHSLPRDFMSSKFDDDSMSIDEHYYGEEPVMPHEPPRAGSKPEMPEFITPREEVREVSRPKVQEKEIDFTKPVFVLIEDFKLALAYIGEIKLSLRESGEVANALGRVKNDEDKAYSLLYNCIEDLQRKLVFADNVLFEKTR